MKKTGAVLLAAGLSSRMGELKPMLPFAGTTVARYQVALMKRLGLDPVVVVTGHRSAELEEHLSFAGVRFIKNERYRESQMFDSVLLGLRAAGECERVLILPMDMPAIREETYLRVLQTDGQIVRAAWKGQPKHPILISRQAASRLEDYRGSAGLKGALEELHIPIVDVEVDDEGVCRDMDTPEQYQALLAWCQKRENAPIVPRVRVCLSAGKEGPFFGPGTAELLERIDETGSLQEACIRMGLSYSKGRKLIKAVEDRLGLAMTRRRAGGCGGGGSQLTEDGRVFLRRFRQLEEETSAAAFQSFKRNFLHGREHGRETHEKTDL